MTDRVEYGSKDAADAARERHSDHLCSDDDRRLKTVAFASTLPDSTLESERIEAADSRDDGADGAGQVPLTDTERDGIDFTQKRANTAHARSVKGIAQKEGVEDWTAFYDGTLTVDEHREVMADAARESGSRSGQESVDEKAGRAARAAQGSQCDHARGHCENGDPEACEFLTETCGYDEQEISQFIDADESTDETEQTELVTVGGGEYPEMEVTPAVAGALSDSWTGYKAALGDLTEAIQTAREAVINGRQSIRAINRIRESEGQDALHPNGLHDLLEALRAMPGDIPEVRTLDHFSADPDPSLSKAPEQEAMGRPADPDAATVDGETGSAAGSQFAAEKQGALDVAAEQETKAEESQVTLTGDEATAANAALPADWTRRGTTWRAGPYSVEMDSHDGKRWTVRLRGDGERLDLLEGHPDAAQADEIAEEFTDRLDPDDVSFHSGDSETQEAVAAAKKAVLDEQDGGLSEFT